MSADGSLIGEAIFRLPADVIAGHCALLKDTSLLNILTAKVTNFFEDKKGNALSEKIANSAFLISSTVDDIDIRLMLIAELSKLFDVPPRQFLSMRDFDDSLGDVVTAAAASLRDADEKFTGSSLQDLVQFVIETMFGEVGKKFESLSTAKQEDILEAVRSFIAQLPQDQQATLRGKLGIDDLSDSYLRKAVVSGSFATAFAGAVSIGGFGFYMGAVSLLSSVAGIIGLTLPFAFYTSLTSMIAVAANPLFILPALGGGGFLLYQHQNNNLRRRIAINSVVQLALAASSLPEQSGGADNRRRAIHAWQIATENLQKAESRRSESAAVVSNGEKSLDMERAKRLHITASLAALSADKDGIVNALRKLIGAAYVEIYAGGWGERARPFGDQLQVARSSKSVARSKPLRDGFFTGLIDNIGRSVEISKASMSEQATLADVTAKLIELRSTGNLVVPPTAKAQFDRLDSIVDKVERLTAERSLCDREISSLQKKLRAAEAEANYHRKQAGLARSRYWGLSL